MMFDSGSLSSASTIKRYFVYRQEYWKGFRDRRGEN